MTMTRVKATAAAAAVAVAGLALLALVFGGLNLFVHPKPDYTQWQGQVRTELMPADSPEYLERHYVGPNGKDLKTEILYRNGDKGVKIYRPQDNTLETWDVDFAIGGSKLHAVFAKDGRQVILGHEYRDDRTLKWKASNKDGTVQTATFYYDGTTLFSLVERKIGNDTTDATYLRKDGKPWMHRVSTLFNTSSPALEEVWDKDGTKVYMRQRSADGKSTTVTYYRDGKPAFKQTWGEYTVSYGYPYGYGYGDDGYGGSYTQTVLKSVEEYAEDGTTVARLIINSDDGSKVATVTTYASDGTSVVYHVTDGAVAHVDKQDKDGHVVSGSDPKPGEVKLEIGDDLKKSLPTAPAPDKYWESQEKDPSKRGEDAP